MSNKEMSSISRRNLSRRNFLKLAGGAAAGVFAAGLPERARGEEVNSSRNRPDGLIPEESRIPEAGEIRERNGREAVKSAELKLEQFPYPYNIDGYSLKMIHLGEYTLGCPAETWFNKVDPRFEGKAMQAILTIESPDNPERTYVYNYSKLVDPEGNIDFPFSAINLLYNLGINPDSKRVGFLMGWDGFLGDQLDPLMDGECIAGFSFPNIRPYELDRIWETTYRPEVEVRHQDKVYTQSRMDMNLVISVPEDVPPIENTTLVVSGKRMDGLQINGEDMEVVTDRTDPNKKWYVRRIEGGLLEGYREFEVQGRIIGGPSSGKPIEIEMHTIHKHSNPPLREGVVWDEHIDKYFSLCSSITEVTSLGPVPTPELTETITATPTEAPELTATATATPSSTPTAEPTSGQTHKVNIPFVIEK